jgi:hypothetical protein
MTGMHAEGCTVAGLELGMSVTGEKLGSTRVIVGAIDGSAVRFRYSEGSTVGSKVSGREGIGVGSPGDAVGESVVAIGHTLSSGGWRSD